MGLGFKSLGCRQGARSVRRLSFFAVARKHPAASSLCAGLPAIQKGRFNLNPQSETLNRVRKRIACWLSKGLKTNSSETAPRHIRDFSPAMIDAWTPWQVKALAWLAALLLLAQAEDDAYLVRTFPKLTATGVPLLRKLIHGPRIGTGTVSGASCCALRQVPARLGHANAGIRSKRGEADDQPCRSVHRGILPPPRRAAGRPHEPSFRNPKPSFRDPAHETKVVGTRVLIGASQYRAPQP